VAIIGRDYQINLVSILDGASGGGASPSVKRLPPLKIGGKDCLPFQLQIEYTGKDGSLCVRVISQAKPITTDRDVAERGECLFSFHIMY